MTRFRVGVATDTGQVRANNQDAKLVVDAESVFAVADGMGGHRGGEVASALAVETLEAVVTAPTGASFVAAVQEANRRIYHRADKTPELRGMGTTLVAIALVDRGTEREGITWVNVGDSRVYLLRDGDLIQLSRDHNLVEDLRREGLLSDDEAATHPQRNIITRALGIEPQVEVDADSVAPLRGDRFLLCSDGLFNEVDRATLVATLLAIDDPQEASDELVRLANAHGGRDNITCVLVDVIDDGRAPTGPDATLAAPSDAASASADDTLVAPAVTLDGPEPSPVGAGEATAGGDDGTPAGDDDPSAGPEPDDGLLLGWPPTDLADDLDRARGRRTARRALGAAAVVVLLAGGTYLASRWWAYHEHFVGPGGPSGTEVVVYRGQPGGFLVFDPSPAYQPGIDVDDLSLTEQRRVRARPTFGSLAEARSWVDDLRARAERRAEAARTSTTTPGTSTTTGDTGTTTTVVAGTRGTPPDATTGATRAPTDTTPAPGTAGTG